MNQSNLSRRQLLKGIGLGMGALAVAACAPGAVPGAAPASSGSAAESAPAKEKTTVVLWREPWN